MKYSLKSYHSTIGNLRRKTILIFLIIYIFVISLNYQNDIPCGSAQEKVIKYGVDPDWPPGEFDDNGEAKGFNSN